MPETIKINKRKIIHVFTLLFMQQIVRYSSLTVFALVLETIINKINCLVKAPKSICKFKIKSKVFLNTVVYSFANWDNRLATFGFPVIWLSLEFNFLAKSIIAMFGSLGRITDCILEKNVYSFALYKNHRPSLHSYSIS